MFMIHQACVPIFIAHLVHVHTSFVHKHCGTCRSHNWPHASLLIHAGVLVSGKGLVQLLCTDPEVISSCLALLPLLCGLIFFDGMNAVVSGVLRGSGRQALGATVNAIGCCECGDRRM